MSSEKLKGVQEALRGLTEFLKPAMPFVNTHLNHFFTESLWDTYLPPNLQRDLDCISVADLKSKFKALANIKHGDEMNGGKYCGKNVSFCQSSLDDVVHRIGQLLLASTKMSVEINNLWTDIEKGQTLECDGCKEREESFCGEHSNQRVEWSRWKFDPFMSQKKMHEVEIMSEFIQALAKLRHVKSININGAPTTHGGPKNREGIKFLVDVGSGKGYLSSFMTLLYDFRVLALDSSAINTYGCAKRTETLQKNWSSFVRRARERQEEQSLTKRGKHWKSKCTGGQGVNNHDDDDEGIKIAHDVSQVETDTAVKYGTVVTDTTAPVSCTTTNAAPPDMTESDNEKLKNLTLFVTENLNLTELLRETFPGSFDAPTTAASNVNNSLSSFAIIGLHTCGNLGVTSVKLFANAKNAKFIVNVPCCYHLMDEAYALPEPGFEGSGTPGFPLSKDLTRTEFYFGRNARMMSAQSIHRMSSEDEDGLNIPRPLLYRAILQVIIRERQGPRLLENSVGRLGSKFTDFGQYVRKALNKIKLDSLDVSDEDIESTFKKYSAQSERFHKYFLLRALFAPLIEACILLDRLAYLLEQDDIQDAFIVEMFNPFLSPRCHALVAVR